MNDCPTCHRPFERTKRMCSSCHKAIRRGHRWHVDGYVNRHDDCSNPTLEQEAPPTLALTDHIQRVTYLDKDGREIELATPVAVTVYQPIELLIDPNAPTISESISLVFEEQEVDIETLRAMYPVGGGHDA